MFHENFRVLQGSFKGSFNQISSGSQEHVKDVIRMFLGSFNKLFIVFQINCMLHGTQTFLGPLPLETLSEIFVFLGYDATQPFLLPKCFCINHFCLFFSNLNATQQEQLLSNKLGPYYSVRE